MTSHISTPLATALPQVLVLDTCVLISNVLRRWLLRLADQGYLSPAWSAIIGDEWQRNASRLWGVTAEDVREQWAQLQASFPAADQGDVQPYKTGLMRSDPKDWHVIAAARAARAHAPNASVGILTRNTRDFNRSELRDLGILLFDPDTYLLRCWHRNPDVLVELFQEASMHPLSLGKEVDPIEDILKRERLFRLNRAYAEMS